MAEHMQLPRFEQLAWHAGPGIPEIVERYVRLGVTDWVYDTVEAEGTVFGVPVTNKADLAFCYQLGPFEVELIKYRGNLPDNWLAVRGKGMRRKDIYMSHMGYHVTNMGVELAMWKQAGIEIAQEVRTLSHTNPRLVEKGRHYHYVVLDTLDMLGYFVKLISRLDTK